MYEQVVINKNGEKVNDIHHKMSEQRLPFTDKSFSCRDVISVERYVITKTTL